MAVKVLVIITSLTLGCLAQRPSFAGQKPIGFPEPQAATTTPQSALGNRFGSENGTTASTTTERLPIEAMGNRDLIERIRKLPADKQPFWYLNWQALEAHRQNPQTYVQKPNVFIDGSTHTLNDWTIEDRGDGQTV